MRPAVRTRRPGVLAATIAATVLVAAACGDDGDDADTATTSGSVDATNDSTTGTDTGSTGGDSEGDSAAATGDGGTLRYGAANALTRFDPHRSSNGYDQNWLAPVYDRLIWQTPDVEPEPGLATEWEFVDDTTFEMTLREGVTFHDGEPFDAQAVADNIDRAKNVEDSGVHAYLASVDDVEVVDDHTVRFLLNRPDATLPMQLATRPGMIVSPAAFDNADLDTNPVGTGPYKLVSYVQDDRAVYEPNPDYWNPDYATLDRLEIVHLADSAARFNALRSGQVDATVLDVAQIDEASAEPGLNVDVADTLEVMHFQLDRTKSEFDDPLVRQALSHAIDREAIVEGPMRGYAVPATQWVPPDTPYYVDDIGESTTYDPDRARELLDEAGLSDGFEFSSMVSVQPIYVQLAEVLQSQFAEIGVTMSVEQETNLADAFFTREATEAITSAYPGRIDPAETAQIYFNDESFSNPGRHVTDNVKDAWIESLLPGDDRPERLAELSRAIDDDALGIPIMHPQVGLASTEQVQGLEWYLSGHIEFAGVTASE